MSWLSRIFAAPRRAMRHVGRAIRAGYDAARTTPENRKHWQFADGLSANAALSPGERATVRQRARYEVANNCYAAGLVRTVANDLIGTGPKLQITAPDRHDASPIEKSWRKWAKEVKLARKLRCMRQCLSRDGEAFAVLVNNPKLRHPVKLDLRLIEADQVSTPGMIGPNAVDGILFDEWGNPEVYHVLRNHPGDPIFSMEKDDVPAEFMIHWFRLERPGQRRGVPTLAPALHLFAKLRRWTTAVLGCAEACARQIGVFYTEAPALTEDAAAAEDLDSVELEGNQWTFAPAGYRAELLRPEQPQATYSEFKAEIIDEVARCENVPSNIARGNSSAYNYASGRLDNQMFGRSQEVDHAEVEDEVLARIYEAWIDEAALEPGIIPDGFPPMSESEVGWMWDGREHVDPNKEANAQATKLANLTTSLTREWAKQGEDFEAIVPTLARERALLKEYGLSLPDATAVTTSSSAASSLSDVIDQPAAGGGFRTASLNRSGVA